MSRRSRSMRGSTSSSNVAAAVAALRASRSVGGEQDGDAPRSIRDSWTSFFNTDVSSVPSWRTPESEVPTPKKGHGGGAVGAKRGGRQQGNRRSILLGEFKNEDNIFGYMAERPLFQNTTLVVIVLNCLWIFIDTQYNHKCLAIPYPDGSLPLEPYSAVVENVFCIYFSAEVLIRFLAFRVKIYSLRDPWFIFDSALQGLMIIDVWAVPFVSVISDTNGKGSTTNGIRSMRLLRLLRLTRMARLARFFPELMTLVKGIYSATQAVGFILLFLFIVTYIFAIIFTVQLGSPDTPPISPDDAGNPTALQMFANLGMSMLTLVCQGMLGDNLFQAISTIKEESLPLMWVFVLYFFISSMTLLNMLVGVLCTVIEETARTEEEAHQVFELKTTLRDAFLAVDSSRDGTITMDEFGAIRNDPVVREMFLHLGVDASQMDKRLDQMQTSLFSRSGKGKTRSDVDEGLSFDEFVDKVVDLRWGTPASVLDLEMLRAQVVAQDKELKVKLERVEQGLELLLGRLSNRDAPLSPWSPAAKRPLTRDRAPPTSAVRRSQACPEANDRGNHGQPPSRRTEDAYDCDYQYDYDSEEPSPPRPSARSPSPAPPLGQPRLLPGSGGDRAPASWLQEVPTALLLHVLRARAPPQAGVGEAS